MIFLHYVNIKLLRQREREAKPERQTSINAGA